MSASRVCCEAAVLLVCAIEWRLLRVCQLRLACVARFSTPERKLELLTITPSAFAATSPATLAMPIRPPIVAARPAAGTFPTATKAAATSSHLCEAARVKPAVR